MEKNKVLIVDDEDINIDVLRNALSDDYNIYAVKDGHKCIEIMKKIRPDIVLLDVIMPEIDGYDTIKLIKEDPSINEIPVIFLTALKDIESKTRGFELGAVDYVTKPFYTLEIKARVKTQIEIQHSKNEVKDLLSKTLSGSIQMLMEILSISNPTAFAMATRIKNLVRKISVEMKMDDIWKLELAGMLSMIGCYALPAGTLEKILLGQEVGLEEQKLYSYYNTNGAKLLSKIPRMEEIAEIVNSQKEHMGNIPIDKKNLELTGTMIVNHALNFEILKYRRFSNEQALLKMMEEKYKYSEEILSKMKIVLSKETQIKNKEIDIEQIEIGMIVEEDITNKSGKIIIKQGMAASEIMIEHLLLLSRIGDIGKKIKVRVK